MSDSNRLIATGRVQKLNDHGRRNMPFACGHDVCLLRLESNSQVGDLGLATCCQQVGTGAAAFHLNRREQTLRDWACYENGPLRPRRINGRLAWVVADIRRVLGAET